MNENQKFTRKNIQNLFDIPKKTLADKITTLKVRGLISGTIEKPIKGRRYEVFSNSEYLIIKKFLFGYQKQNKNLGYVYLLKDFSGHIKIGFATDIKARFKVIKSNNPTIKVLSIIQGATKNTESKLLKLCKDYNTNNEWFIDKSGYLERFLKYHFQFIRLKLTYAKESAAS